MVPTPQLSMHPKVCRTYHLHCHYNIFFLFLNSQGMQNWQRSRYALTHIGHFFALLTTKGCMCCITLPRVHMLLLLIIQWSFWALMLTKRIAQVCNSYVVHLFKFTYFFQLQLTNVLLGRTILHIAVPRNSGGYFGHVLAKLEPSIDMKDNLGLTPLQLSILLGQYISEFLLAIAKCNPITTQHILSCSIYCQANMLRCKN